MGHEAVWQFMTVGSAFSLPTYSGQLPCLQSYNQELSVFNSVFSPPVCCAQLCQEVVDSQVPHPIFVRGRAGVRQDLCMWSDALCPRAEMDSEETAHYAIHHHVHH